MALDIWRAVISSDMGLVYTVYCARAARSQSLHLLAIEYLQVS
jgi:hypothetical protein